MQLIIWSDMRNVLQEHTQKTHPLRFRPQKTITSCITKFCSKRIKVGDLSTPIHFQRWRINNCYKKPHKIEGNSFRHHILNGTFPELDWSSLAFVNLDFSVAISWKRFGPPKLCLKPLNFFLFPLSYSSSLKSQVARYKFINIYVMQSYWWQILWLPPPKLQRWSLAALDVS